MQGCFKFVPKQPRKEKPKVLSMPDCYKSAFSMVR